MILQSTIIGPTAEREPDTPNRRRWAVGPNLLEKFFINTAPDVAMAALFDTGLGEVAEAGKAISSVAEESVSVYQKAETAYVGITKNLAAREAQHGEPLVKVVGNLTRKQARGVEQAIIENKGLANLTTRSTASQRRIPFTKKPWRVAQVPGDVSSTTNSRCPGPCFRTWESTPPTEPRPKSAVSPQPSLETHPAPTRKMKEYIFAIYSPFC